MSTNRVCLYQTARLHRLIWGFVVRIWYEIPSPTLCITCMSTCTNAPLSETVFKWYITFLPDTQSDLGCVQKCNFALHLMTSANKSRGPGQNIRTSSSSHFWTQPWISLFLLNTAKLQWLGHRWLVYRGWFLLVFESLWNSSDSSRKQIIKDFFFYFIMKMYVVCTY